MVRDSAPLPGYPEPYDVLCAVLHDATSDFRKEMTWAANTREELDALFPAELMTWRVRPGGQSAGAVMLHVIVVELFWFEEFVLGREIEAEVKKELMWDEIDVDNDRWPDAPNQPIGWYFDLHDRYRARSLETIKQWPAADTVKDSSWGNQYTMRWVLGHVIQHESYHGGQIILLHDLWKHRDD